MIMPTVLPGLMFAVLAKAPVQPSGAAGGPAGPALLAAFRFDNSARPVLPPVNGSAFDSTVHGRTHANEVAFRTHGALPLVS